MANSVFEADPERERALQEGRRAQRFREEAAEVANDPEDVAEMRQVMADLESLRAW